MIPGPLNPNHSYNNLQYLQANDPHTSEGQLKSIAATATCPKLLVCVALNANTPLTVLNILALHSSAEVRIAVSDNPTVPAALLEDLAGDKDDDVRYAVAENHNVPAHVLLRLMEDSNPYVATRAEKTLEKLKAEFGPDFLTPMQKEERNLITLLIAEDNEFVRSLIRRSLNSHHRILVVGDVGDGKTTISEVLKLKPHVVLMDIGMPVIDGVAATRMIKESLPNTRVIMVTAREEAEDINNAFEAGADGYYLKSSSLSELAQAVVTVADGGKWLDPGISSTILRKCFNRISVIGAEKTAEDLNEDIDKTSIALEILNYESERLSGANKIGEALAVAKAALAVAIAQYGKDSKQAVAQLTALAELHYAKEDYRSSESLMLQAIRSREELLAHADRETDQLINFLGKMSESSGNNQQAELYYSWSLRIRERLGDEDKIAETRDRLSLFADTQEIVMES